MISPSRVYWISPGSAVVKGPYVAETLAVSVESHYVVVDL